MTKIFSTRLLKILHVIKLRTNLSEKHSKTKLDSTHTCNTKTRPRSESIHSVIFIFIGLFYCLFILIWHTYTSIYVILFGVTRNLFFVPGSDTIKILRTFILDAWIIITFFFIRILLIPEFFST